MMKNKKPKHKYTLPKKCPYCKGEDIKLMSQKEFYGKNFNGTNLYVCQGCNARAGCHKGGKGALGCLADEELRGLRNQIHKIIDPIWLNTKERRQNRSKIYEALGEKYGGPFHVGHLNNEKARWVLHDLKENNFINKLDENR